VAEKNRFLILKASLHNHTDEQGSHRAGYPVKVLLTLLRKENFNLAAITDHRRLASRKAFSLARNYQAGRLWLLQGFEAEEDGAHVVDLNLSRTRRYRFFCHPYRTFSEEWTRQVRTFACRCQAVELDQFIAFTPELLAPYQSLMDWRPVLATADFHSNVFALKNFFTVLLGEEKSPAALAKALQQGNFIAFYPDILDWKRKFLTPAGSLLTFLQKKHPEFFLIEPAVFPEAMTEKEIEQYWHCRVLTLKNGSCSLSLLPDFGGQLVSFKVGKKQIFSPVFPTFLETPRSFAAYPTFESNFSSWKILSRSSTSLSLEYRIRNGPWKGLSLRREIALNKKGVAVRLWQENHTGKPLPFAGCVSLNFVKRPGQSAKLETLPPGPVISEKTPWRALIKCSNLQPVRMRLTGSASGSLSLQAQVPLLEEIHLWDNLFEMKSLVSFHLKEEAIPERGKGNETTLYLEVA